MLEVVVAVVGVAVGAAAAFAGLRLLASSRLNEARRACSLVLDEARRDADATRREAAIEAREQAVRVRAELEAELRERRDEVVKIEERVLAKEDDIDQQAHRDRSAASRGSPTARCISASCRRR